MHNDFYRIVLFECDVSSFTLYVLSSTANTANSQHRTFNYGGKREYFELNTTNHGRITHYYEHSKLNHKPNTENSESYRTNSR